jgi:hypothetical protein
MTVQMVALHTDPVAQDGSAGQGACRVDGENSNRLSMNPRLLHKTVDQSALARPGRTGHAYDCRVA